MSLNDEERLQWLIDVDGKCLISAPRVCHCHDCPLYDTCDPHDDSDTTARKAKQQLWSIMIEAQLLDTGDNDESN